MMLSKPIEASNLKVSALTVCGDDHSTDEGSSTDGESSATSCQAQQAPTKTAGASSRSACHEESTDEGSSSSDSEPSAVPYQAPAKQVCIFSRSALQEKGRATLAHIAAAEAHQLSQTWAYYSRTAIDEIEKISAFMAKAPTSDDRNVTQDKETSVSLSPTLEKVSAPIPHASAIRIVAPSDSTIPAVKNASTKKPMKVRLPESYKCKTLDMDLPAKKRPAFPEMAGRPKQLDPNVPAKKRVSQFLIVDGSDRSDGLYLVEDKLDCDAAVHTSSQVTVDIIETRMIEDDMGSINKRQQTKDTVHVLPPATAQCFSENKIVCDRLLNDDHQTEDASRPAREGRIDARRFVVDRKKRRA